MFRNYFITGWRSLATNKLYSLINISGLAIGLAVCMLIVLYVGHESGYDKFHEKANRICRVQTKLKIGNDSLYMPYLEYLTGIIAKQNIPSIESFLRYKTEGRNTIIQNPQSSSLKFTENKFLFADSNFFSFFSFKLIQGQKDQALQNPFSVVISQNAAEKYFGNQDPVGKIIRYNNAYDFIVTGVAEKTPSNSSIEYDFVASLSSMASITGEKDFVANNENVFSTYLLLKQPKDDLTVEAGLSQLDKANGNNKHINSKYIITPLTSIHLQEAINTSNTKYLKIFPFAAALILLLALVNYMSLSTARSTVRSKEIGVRKVLGANRKTIAAQFFVESALCTVIAFAFGYVLCVLFQPFFFNFLQIDIDNSFLYSSSALLSFALLFIITVLLAATYPSVLLSAYKPVMVLYGKFSKQSGGVGVRKFFTVFQFTVTVILIICGIVIERQMYFFRHTDTGVNKENIVMVPFAPDIGKHYAAFKKEIQSLPAIQQISVALYPMYNQLDMMGTKPKNGDKMILLPLLSVDQNFISMLGLQWKTPPADSLFYQNQQTTAVLNETAVEKLNLGFSPINQEIDNRYKIAGVVNDFNYASLQNKIDALCLLISKDNDTSSSWAQQGGCMLAKTNAHVNIPALIQQLKNIHEKYDNAKPFEYHFMDDAFDAQYKAEDRLSKIFSVFTAFTVLIASLGLFGLATFVAVQRTKEIGIRKVLGASVESVVTLLSKDFIKLVITAIVIASPVAWWFMNQWLQNFAYRITISWWMFALAGMMVILIALATVSFQSIKAATTNPVKSLRTE